VFLLSDSVVGCRELSKLPSGRQSKIFGQGHRVTDSSAEAERKTFLGCALVLPDGEFDARFEGNEPASPRQDEEPAGKGSSASPSVLEVTRLASWRNDSGSQGPRSLVVYLDCEPEPQPRRKGIVLGPNLEYLREIDEPPEVIDSNEKAPARLRQLMVLMERPFFALGKRRVDPLEYLSPDSTIQIRVQPGPDGMATIYDADVIMFLVNQLTEAQSGAGGTVIVKGGAYLRAVGSRTGGDQYALLAKTIQRLLTTHVTTNARPDGKPGPVRTFAWIEKAIRQGNDWHITVSGWLAEGARSKFVLDICPEYFDLGGFDRFLYLAARKHVGRERGKVFPIKVTTLWGKSGSGSKLFKFRHEIKSIATKNQLPEYWLEWKDEPSHDGLLLIRRK
jgi:hypothetical protein